jgi:hypothetical protein
MRAFVAAIVAVSLVSSSAFAATETLVPGRPAGVQKAALAGNGLVILLSGLAVVGLGIASLSSNDAKNVTSSTTTTTTGTP